MAGKQCRMLVMVTLADLLRMIHAVQPINRPTICSAENGNNASSRVPPDSRRGIIPAKRGSPLDNARKHHNRADDH